MLHKTILLGLSESIKFLIDNGACLESRDKDDNTPLHFAVYKGLVQIINLLLESGADINSKNKYNETPLFCAILEGPTEFWNDIHVNLETPDYFIKMGMNPFGHVIAHSSSDGIVKLLITAGADLSIENSFGLTPLHLAIYNNFSVETIQLLIDSGSDCQMKNRFGVAPADCCCSQELRNFFTDYHSSDFAE